MSWIPLDDVRDQVGILAGDTDHDAKLSRYALAAEQAIEAFLNRRVLAEVSSESSSSEDDEDAIVVNEAILAAGILIAAEMMANRENPEVLSPGVVALLFPYRIGLGV